jgi:hypothetical protein
LGYKNFSGLTCKLKEILNHKSEVGSPVNHSLEEKNGSIVINKDISLLERSTSLKIAENAKSHSYMHHFSKYAGNESGPSNVPKFNTIPSLATMELKESTAASMN